MAHTRYTGKGVIAKYGADVFPGWRKVTIEETGAEGAPYLDVTAAGDSAYTYAVDPMGSKGAASCSVTIEGLASKTDVADSGIFAEAMDAALNVTIQKVTGSGKDLFTMTSGKLKERSLSPEVATLVTYTVKYELDAAGVWSASA